MRPTIFGLIVLAVLVTAQGAAGAGPPRAEPLPPPTPVPAVVYPIVYPRVSRYAVWDLYAVDRSGRFVPRVAYTPYGSFYLHNREPYHWLTTRPLAIMPYATD